MSAHAIAPCPRPRIAHLTTPLLLAMCALLFAGCAGDPKKKEPGLPTPGVLPAGADMDGMWFSDQFDRMYVRREGDMIRGIYTHKQGGTFEGKLEGNMILFDWIDPGDRMQARRTFKGKGYFVISVDKEGNTKLKGEWGYHDARRGGGIWNATWMRKLDKADPKDLDAYRAKEIR